eukprot:g30286.t1
MKWELQFSLLLTMLRLHTGKTGRSACMTVPILGHEVWSRGICPECGGPVTVEVWMNQGDFWTCPEPPKPRRTARPTAVFTTRMKQTKSVLSGCLLQTVRRQATQATAHRAPDSCFHHENETDQACPELLIASLSVLELQCYTRRKAKLGKGSS